MSDRRFEPGTVADIGYAIRLKLRKINKKDEYSLLLQIRTLKKYNNEDTLKQENRVASFKKCMTLQEAQKRTEEWFNEWLNDILNNSYL